MKAKRKRIVINLDAQSQRAAAGFSSAPRRGRAGRVLGFIALILIVVVLGAAAGGYFWWQNYKSKPAYTLALLIDAAHRNDKAEIDRLLDMDKITDNFVSQVRQRAAGSYSSAIGSLTPSQMDRVAAGITPKLKQTLHDQLPAEIHRLSEPAAGKPFALIALAIPYFLDIKQEGETARAGAKVSDEKAQLTLQKGASGQWRIVAVDDDRLAGIIADSVKKDLSQPRGLQNEVEQRLKGLTLP